MLLSKLLPAAAKVRKWNRKRSSFTSSKLSIGEILATDKLCLRAMNMNNYIAFD
jgi:hypothetical protein